MFSAGRDSVGGDQKLLRWLSRGSFRVIDATQERLNMTLELLGMDPVMEGLAALRFWGQTGERSTSWMAAADPVHLEPMINDLRVLAFSADELKASELRQIYADLQASLAAESELAFAGIGKHGYVRGNADFPVADVSPRIAHGHSVDEFSPAADPDGMFHRWLGEIQLALHQHEINEARELAGQRAINSLWFWGAGAAPEKDVKSIPPLFGNDEVFLGYWESCTGVAEKWDGDFARCLDIAVGDFVVVNDETESFSVVKQLHSLQRMLSAKEISALVLLFADGWSIELDRFSKFRFWRRRPPFFDNEKSQ